MNASQRLEHEEFSVQEDFKVLLWKDTEVEDGEEIRFDSMEHALEWANAGSGSISGVITIPGLWHISPMDVRDFRNWAEEAICSN